MESKLKSKIINLLRKGMKLTEVLEIVNVSKYQHLKYYKNDSSYRGSILQVRSELQRIPTDKVENFLQVYKKTQNIEKTLGKTRVSITQYKNERRLNHVFYKEIFKIKNHRDRDNKNLFLKILEENRGDFKETYRITRFIPQMVQSWIKKDKDFLMKKDEILERFKGKNNNLPKKKPLHPYEDGVHVYRTPQDPKATEVLDGVIEDYHGALTKYGKVVADTCRSCDKIYLIENFYYNINSPTEHMRICFHCLGLKYKGSLRNRVGRINNKDFSENYRVNANDNIVEIRCKVCKKMKRRNKFGKKSMEHKTCISCKPQKK
jgi:hypothetical protein